MKLIDILIKNDIKWPEGATGAVQDGDGEVKFYAGGKIGLIGRMWVGTRYVAIYGTCFTETASDYNTTIVTKQQWENHKMSKAMFANVKVGDKVWDIRMGWGVVDELELDSYYPISVDFTHVGDTYTLEGFHRDTDVNPSLFWDEIEIKAPPAPLPKLEMDTKVVVWQDDGSKVSRHFSHFGKDGVLHAFVGGLTSFTSKGSTTAWGNWELAE